MAATRTLATLAGANQFGRVGSTVLVGRLVANTGFVEALARHAEFDVVRFYVGEGADADGVRELFEGCLGSRLETRSLLDLPRDLGRGEVDVLHHGSHLDRFADLVWLRDRYASKNVPVTGQIHTLSYPRSTSDLLRYGLLAPRANDAIFCSTESGRRVVEELITSLAERSSAHAGELACRLPVVPLGIDAEALSGGDRATTRAQLEIPPEAFCALALARFSEYDKMDLFPLLLAFRGVVAKLEQPPILLLAGARQGTKTPEMLQLWSRALGIEAQVRFCVDFPEERKRDLLAAADVFVSPTDNVQETFGITVVEAMAAGLPPIVSDFDGYRESVTDEVGVRLPTSWTPPGRTLTDLGPLLYERPLHLLLGQSVSVDLGRLETALVELAGDEGRRERLAGAARERARERYDWSRVIPRYEATWRELAALPFSAGETVGPSRTHPLAIDYGRVFAHYPTELARPDRLVRTSEHARWMREVGLEHPIYPELANLFDADMVTAALVGAEAPIPAELLASALAESFPNRERWKTDHLVAWMHKQGLLVVVD